MKFASGEWVNLGLLIYVLFVDLCALLLLLLLFYFILFYFCLCIEYEFKGKVHYVPTRCIFLSI